MVKSILKAVDAKKHNDISLLTHTPPLKDMNPASLKTRASLQYVYKSDWIGTTNKLFKQ